MAKEAKVLVVGWDAADWQFMAPLMDAGLMPTLSGLVKRGVRGNLASLQPMLSPILWTSVATGKRGDKHGILSFLEPTADAAGVRVSQSTSRMTKALWNMLSAAGKRCAIVNWYASHPAEPIAGACVSNQFYGLEAAGDGLTLAMPAEAVHPAGLYERIAEMRIAPDEILASDLKPFLPTLGESLPESDPSVRALARELAHTASIQAVATALLEKRDWDLGAVFFDAIDVLGHLFMPCHPPAMPTVSPERADHFAGVMSGIYQFHDMMLARLIALAGPDTTVMVLSDHGFYHDHRRPLSVGESEEEQAAKWHRPLGMLAMAGPGVRQGARVYGSTLLDITPTVLSIFGLPMGRDMEGKVLRTAFEKLIEPPSIESWDAEPGSGGMHPAEMQTDAVSAAYAIRQLEELGYLAAAGEDEKRLVDSVIRESQFNLAGILLDAGDAGAAIPILQGLVKEKPGVVRYQIALAVAYRGRGELAAGLKVLEGLHARGEAPATVIAMQAQMCVAGGDTARARELCDEITNLAAPGDAQLQQAIGLLERDLGNEDAALVALRLALTADPELIESLLAVSAIDLARGNAERAAHGAREVTLRIHAYPAAHHLLGNALAVAGKDVEAIAALNVAISLDPRLTGARRLLVTLYERRGDVLAALEHRKFL